MSDRIEHVYRAFDPGPLPAEAGDLYVDLDDVRGEAGLVDRLAQRIRLADGVTCQLLAGHHGSGKSTELKRLQRELQAGEKRYFVVFCDAGSDLDLNDVDFPEVLIAVVHQLAQQLEDRAEIKLQAGYFKQRWEALKGLLGGLDFSEVELSLGMLKIAGAIKGSPDARAKIREALEPDTGNLLHAANDVIGEAKLELRKQRYSDLVILVDDLDKIVLRPHGVAGCSTSEYLFIHRHAQLSAFQCHMVYSMPLALAYSAQEPKIASLYGRRVPIIPMTKLTQRPPSKGTCKPGIERFRDIIATRLKSAGVDDETVFESSKLRDRLIRLSGGQPRELMILLREAIIGGGLPIGATAIDRAEREGRRAYARQLHDEHWKMIRQVRKDGKLRRTRDNEELIWELLDSRAILQYLNTEEWYGVNPVAREATRRKAK